MERAENKILQNFFFMNYAIIKTGSKQYRVQSGDVLDVELVPGEPKDTMVFEEVLLLSDGTSLKTGSPTVEGAKVTAEIIDNVRAPKVTAFKYRRRKGYHRTIGHRQKLTRVRIKEISA